MVVKSKKFVEYNSEGVLWLKKFGSKSKKIVEYTSEGIFCNHRKKQKSFRTNSKKLWNTIVRGYFAFIKNQKKCPIKDERFFLCKIFYKCCVQNQKKSTIKDERIFCNHRKNQKSFHKKTKKLWNILVRGFCNLKNKMY